MAKKKATTTTQQAARTNSRLTASTRIVVTDSDEENAIPLTQAERAVLDEILDEGRDVVDEVGKRIISYGRFVLRRVGAKASSATSPTGPKAPSNLWREVHRRAGGPTLRLSQKTLSIAIRLAAWEQVLNSDNFNGLDYERKVALLPLNDAALMRKSADKVADLRMTLRDTIALVDVERAKLGRAAIRRLTPDRAIGHARRLTKAFGDEKAMGRLLAALPELDDEKREELKGELGEAFALLKRLMDALDE